MKHNINKISILGDGGWGTTLALLLNSKGFSVTLWSAFKEYTAILNKGRENTRYLPGFNIPEPIVISDDIHEAISDAQLVVVAIPSQHLRNILVESKIGNLTSKKVLSVIKGVEQNTFKRPSEILKEELAISDVAVLSGPTIALELANGLPTSAVIAADGPELAMLMQEVFMSETLRIYASADVIGVELGGALKNIMAIAAGISDGLGLGTNAKASLFTRGLVEMKRVGFALGGSIDTFNGLSGMGDLVTTCVSKHSRNRHVGEEIAKGKKLDQILKEMVMVAEGVDTSKSVYELSKRLNIQTPITDQVYKVLFEDKNPLKAVKELMKRDRKSEAV
ncbi:NAD(P)H-dependent glycerol-3-phosphate dehydrogenase [Candidatus Omnitrophota bacterium]